MTFSVLESQVELDSDSISLILQLFLHRSIENITSAYIHGKTSCFYAADGKLIKQDLEDEEAFQERFVEAQSSAQIPKSAWIKLSG
jgi:hypothetical protein